MCSGGVLLGISSTDDMVASNTGEKIYFDILASLTWKYPTIKMWLHVERLPKRLHVILFSTFFSSHISKEIVVFVFICFGHIQFLLILTLLLI